MTAKDFNVFVFGSFTGVNTDIQGGLAAGGNVSLTNYGIGGGLTNAANTATNLAVGGKLTVNNVQSNHGNVVAGSYASGNSGFTVLNGTASTGTPPVDFASEQSRLTSLSTTLGAMATTNGTTTNFQYGTLSLGTTSSGVSVFDLTATTLLNTNTFNLTSTAANAIVLINVSGTAATLQNFGFNYTGIDASHVLFNFSDATTLTLSSISVLGSVLAPKAAVTFNNGQFNGELIANTLNGTGEFHLATFQGTLLDPPKVNAAVPEPSTWATMVSGFGIAGFALRRRRRAPLAA